jgi:hypothetical protein
MTQAYCSHSTSSLILVFILSCLITENASAVEASSAGLICNTSEVRSGISKQHVDLSDQNSRAVLMQTSNIAGLLAATKSMKQNENIAKQQVDLSNPENRAARMQSLDTAESTSRPLPNLSSTVTRSPNRQD